ARGWGSLVVGPAHNERWHFHRRELRHKIEIKDRCRAPEIACGCGGGNGGMDLLPSPGIARSIGIGEPTLHGLVGKWRQAVRLLYGRNARSPRLARSRWSLRGGVAKHGRSEPLSVADGERLAHHPTDREADEVHSRDLEKIERLSNVITELLHCVVAGAGI